MRDPDLLWFDIVNRFAQQSKCRSRQVGAILVDHKNHMFGQGFNSAPFGSNTDDCPRCNSKQNQSGKNLDQAVCVHAEINCIASAARSGRSTVNAKLYCTTYPCAECAKAIVTAGISAVIYNDEYPSLLSESIFKNAKVSVRKNIHAT